MSQSRSRSASLDLIKAHVENQLVPLANRIDVEGYYPESFLRVLGELGGFAAAIDVEHGGTGEGLGRQIEVTTAVGKACGSTAFLVWCQAVCAWYLQHTENAAVRERYLKAVAQGSLFAGTGMSNTVKHLAGIEKIHLRAKREGNGYRVSGALPWVSNVDRSHLAIVAAATDDGGYIMFAVPGDAAGLTLRGCPEFIGMKGTKTLGLHFSGVLVGDDDVLAHPQQFEAYIKRIKPGFVLAQTGMGLGIAAACVEVMRDSNVRTAHVNCFLDEQEHDTALQLQQLGQRTAEVAAQVDSQSADMLDVLKLRLQASEQVLAAASSAALHAGARGYLEGHAAPRLQREALFVAIVTPAMKHLRKEIQAQEQARLEAGATSRQSAADGHSLATQALPAAI